MGSGLATSGKTMTDEYKSLFDKNVVEHLYHSAIEIELDRINQNRFVPDAKLLESNRESNTFRTLVPGSKLSETGLSVINVANLDAYLLWKKWLHCRQLK